MSLENIEKLLKYLVKISVKSMKSIENIQNLENLIGDKKSPIEIKRETNLLRWDEEWHPIHGPALKTEKNLVLFKRRYVPRTNGPTRAVKVVFTHLMEYPQNQNFYLKSKRCYVHVKDNLWKLVTPKEFFPELRKKILKHYKTNLEKSQYCTEYLLKSMTLQSFSNRQLESMCGEFGQSSWTLREKTRKN